jgi:beta-glucosidase
MRAGRAARSTAGLLTAALALACPVQAAPGADERAARVVAAMTQQEKLQLVFGYYATDFPKKNHIAPKEARRDSAGYVPGVPRVGVPPQWQADAGMGVATQSSSTQPYERTSLPSSLATAATWNPALAYDAGAMIGKEARLSGYNVMLAGGVNLMRDPRNGRNFEYAGQDPLLAGVMAGEQIRGIQSNHIIATVKHFAYNGQETNRFTVSSELGDAAARMSDLLAFQIAIERGDPGSVMCAYNRVNSVYACESPYLLNEVLKQDWGYKGYVMSDWGATHSTIPAANAGLDQQSGWPFDQSAYFGDALGEAVSNRHVPAARLDDMAHRIVRAMFQHGVMDDPVPATPAGGIDFDAHAAITQAASEEAMVLLKNSGALLPLAAGTRSIAIIGGHADKGVLSGGGSSQVHPRGGMAVPNEGPAHFPGPMVYHPSSPMQALAARSKARLAYLDGKDIAAAATLAAASDVSIVFATQWTAESVDAPSLSLPNGQDELIAAVARANPRTVVVLETGGPVTMPWLDSVGAVLQAWYPGTRGGTAIARVLSGEVNPSGRLPATFPASEAQLPRPAIEADQQRADYNIEGAAVGYKWHDLTGRKPLFAFGHGLSYTSFAYGGLSARLKDGALSVSFTVRNTGKRAGKAVPQVYVAPVAGGWEAPQRLGGWNKLALQPAASASATVTVDPRLLGVYDSASKTWRIAEGDYLVTLASASDAPAAAVHVRLPARTLDVRGRDRSAR